MNKTVRLFVVSDIHGHYTQLIKALEEAGFDKRDPRHLFVCCGDLFDRGRENRKVYDFVRTLERKVLVRGNHDERLADILEHRCVRLNDLYNGIESTLVEFFGDDVIGPYGELKLPKHGKMAGKLRGLVGGMVDYFETEYYVFVHGWVPIRRAENGAPSLTPDWRNANANAWRHARFEEWQALFRNPACRTDKVLVCGHRPTRFASRVDMSRAESDSSIWFGDGVIAIDAGTVRSGRVNVLVLDERLLTGETE